MIDCHLSNSQASCSCLGSNFKIIYTATVGNYIKLGALHRCAAELVVRFLPATMACTASSFFARPGRDLRSAAVRPISVRNAWMAASVGLQGYEVANEHLGYDTTLVVVTR